MVHPYQSLPVMYPPNVHKPLSGYRIKTFFKITIVGFLVWLMIVVIKTSFLERQLEQENFYLKDKIQDLVQGGLDKLKALQYGQGNPGNLERDDYDYDGDETALEAKIGGQEILEVPENAENFQNITEIQNQLQTIKPEYVIDDGITDETRRYIQELNLSNPGQNGEAVVLPTDISDEIKQKVDDGYTTYGFNAFVSSLISLNRNIPDNRSDYCKAKVYRTDLPKCSIVIPIHDDDWSLIMRTVHSIIRYSNMDYVEEIIISDDYSSREHLKQQLTDYVKNLPKVRLVRAHRRLGIVANRVLGARNAIGPIIVFVDSHVEVTPGWLEPILDRLKDNPNLVIWSKISGLDKNTLKLSVDDGVGGIGAFDWGMNFKWIDVRWYERDKPTGKYEPKASPTFMGPTYALWLDFFEKLGWFDVDMDIWGGEDVELGFRAWMCGGRVELVPCSVICHMFREHTYTMKSKDKGGYRWNTDRIAEVWLQDYIRYYYRAVGDTKNRKFGDISERLAIREKCQSFQWYLDNVYPMYEIPEFIRDPTTTTTTKAPTTQAPVTQKQEPIVQNVVEVKTVMKQEVEKEEVKSEDGNVQNINSEEFISEEAQAKPEVKLEVVKTQKNNVKELIAEEVKTRETNPEVKLEETKPEVVTTSEVNIAEPQTNNAEIPKEGATVEAKNEIPKQDQNITQVQIEEEKKRLEEEARKMDGQKDAEEKAKIEQRQEEEKRKIEGK